MLNSAHPRHRRRVVDTIDLARYRLWDTPLRRDPRGPGDLSERTHRPARSALTSRIAGGSRLPRAPATPRVSPDREGRGANPRPARTHAMGRPLDLGGRDGSRPRGA